MHILPRLVLLSKMGQTASSDNSLPDSVETLQDELCRQARVLTEIAALTYEEFQKCLAKLNSLSMQCTDSNGKQLIFAVKKGSDSTVFWKGTVRIACVKRDLNSKKIENYRLLTLGEFLRMFKTLQCQLTAALQSSHLEKSMTQADDTTSSSGNGQAEERRKLAAALLLAEVASATTNRDDGGEKISECCICLERKPDVMLPCAHSYCLQCIEQWNVNNKTCPICREKFDSTDDTWVISEVPGSEEISEEICCSLMDLASTSTVHL